LERDILEVSEMERERIGQDLHDDLGQILTGISLLCKSLQQALETTAPEEAYDVGRIDDLMRQAISQTRQLARGLMPIGLEQHGLNGALEELTTNVDSLPGVSCTYRGIQVDLERSDARHLYRIAQEAINNAIKHGRATQIHVRLQIEEERHTLTVEDNGVGIRNPVDSAEGMGLRLMSYRARKLGGTLEVVRAAGGGTTVRCRF
jgi:signal transduction histidine kinase